LFDVVNDLLQKLVNCLNELNRLESTRNQSEIKGFGGGSEEQRHFSLEDALDDDFVLKSETDFLINS